MAADENARLWRHSNVSNRKSAESLRTILIELTFVTMFLSTQLLNMKQFSPAAGEWKMLRKCLKLPRKLVFRWKARGIKRK